jgi:CTP synthase (UTP-ammonia lyase)
VAAIDDQSSVRAVELDGHPFFVATLFQPEMQPANPLIHAFVRACERRRQSLVRAAS